MTTPDSSARKWCEFPHSAHLDAQVMCLQVYGNAIGKKNRFKGISHLLPDPLLDGESLGEQAYQSRQLGDANDILVCNVTDVRFAEEVKDMMLT